ncbi:hypothetical protein [Hahella sp. HN01]|uniref:hypothetical protein n=1 Tax=Hahella sp. HN01 TaxID=2847262 RepID=UPI001C1EF03C|nr:hypothetical protein [Hahella sp. HN01]MBU6949943.1 hypothetical protein [Hahella sp. HN01]
MQNPPRYPDIEIYILDTNLPDICEWLKKHLTIKGAPLVEGNTHKIHTNYDGADIPVIVVEKASGKRFTSVWFDSSSTPWETDLDCARSAFSALNKEVRCSASGWIEEEEEDAPDLWWKINQHGEKQCNWKD